MTNLYKRRVDSQAASNGHWVERLPGWGNLQIQIRAKDADACVEKRGDLVEQIYGDRNYIVTDKAMAAYLDAAVMCQAAVLNMRNLTDDMGNAIQYTQQYLQDLLFVDRATAEAKSFALPERDTPDGLVFDEDSKKIVGLLNFAAEDANSQAASDEKKPSANGSAGGAASRGNQRTPGSPTANESDTNTEGPDEENTPTDAETTGAA